MRRRTTAEQTLNLLLGVKSREEHGASGLVALGVVGLLPLFAVLGVITANSLESALSALAWTTPLEFWQSAGRWMQRDAITSQIASVVSIFLFGYCLLLWQWIAFLTGRRTLVSSSWLWAVSSAYFIAAILIFATGFYSTRNTSLQWVTLALACCLIPVISLVITLRLWRLETRSHR